jgi:hypothetical protein
MGWVICSIKALYLEIDHPLAEDATTDSVDYLKVREMRNPYSESRLLRDLKRTLADRRFAFRQSSYRATSSTSDSISPRLPS